MGLGRRANFCFIQIVGSSSSVSQPPLLDTPGRKRSQPIAIELPSRGTAAYTPLSARGDLPGYVYFALLPPLPVPTARFLGKWRRRFT